MPKKSESLIDQIIVVAGAGAGGIGVASIIKEGLIRAGLSEEQAQARIFVIDGQGLVVEGHTRDIYKLPLAHKPNIYRDWGIEPDKVPTLLEVITHCKPSVLLGLSGVNGLFTKAMIESMAENHAQPIIFPLSNPTNNCEATPQDLIEWTQGRAIIATGSPFADVIYQGKNYIIDQGNNAFIFPGPGFAAVIGECLRISDEMVLESAYALADYVQENCLEFEQIYPSVTDLKNVSLFVAIRVLAKALEDGSASRQDLYSENLANYVSTHFWQAKYLPFNYKGLD